MSNKISVSFDISHIQSYLEKAVSENRIPGISLAIWEDKTLHSAAAGHLNLNVGLGATTESLFQIGSITKVMTTCLVMQLVDEGQVELDVPVKRYIRDFAIADAEATQAITVRQLLNHTSGIAGDFFPDDHRQEGNPIARYIDRCNLIPLMHPPGRMFSYSNSALAIAGRLVEILRGVSWYQAIDEYVYQPLGMQHAIADPKDGIQHCCATGYLLDNSNNWYLPPRPYNSLGLAPAGSTLAMSASDLIRFARAHLDEGKNQAGEQWLSSASVKQMQTKQIEAPRSSSIANKYAGLGWGLSEYPNNNSLKVISHSGATRGFLSTLQIIPEKDIAFAVLMNGRHPSAMDIITAELLTGLAGLDMTQPEPSSDKPNQILEVVIGQYDSFDTLITVVLQADRLMANIDYKINQTPSERVELRQCEAGCFAVYTQEGKRLANAIFSEEDEQCVPQYLFYGGRQNRRIN